MIEGALHRPIWARIGRIVKAHGLRGEVVVIPDTPARERPWEGVQVYLRDAVGRLSPRKVVRARQGKSGILVLFDCCATREDARPLVSQAVFVPRLALPELPEGEHYHTDLLDCRVWDPDGRPLGTLVDILPSPGADVFVVKGTEDELLLPATKEVILEVNRIEGYLIARPLKEC